MLKVTETDEGLPGYLDSPDDTAETSPVGRQDEWTTTLIMREKCRIAATVPNSTANDKDVLGVILAGVGAPEHETTSAGRLAAFLHIVTALRFDAEHGGLVRKQRANLTDLASALLKAEGIGTSTSMLGFLHGDLELCRSQVEEKQGRFISSIVTQQLAMHLSRRQPSGGLAYQALAAARRCLRLGHATLAAEGFAAAEKLNLPLCHFELARLARIQAHRLAGDVATATALLDGTVATEGLSQAARLELDWERLWLESTHTGDLTKLLAATIRGRPHYLPTYLLEAHLLAQATEESPLAKRLSKLGTVRRLAGSHLHRGSPHSFLLTCVQALEDAHDAGLPLERKLEDARQILGHIGRLRTVDRELLVLVGYARWARRYNQGVLAAVALAEYRSLSLRLTDGRSADALSLVGNLKIEAWSRFSATRRLANFAPAEDSTRGLVASPFGRSLEASKIATAIVSLMAKRRIRSLTGMTAPAGDQETLRLAKMLVRRLGRLKGPLMKVAQALSYMPTFLPELMRGELAALQHGAQPLAGDIIRAAILQELKRPVDQLFTDWEDVPFAAGSIGQVHRARLPDGMRVAVKVRYPSIERVIDSDVKGLLRIEPLIRPFLPRGNLKRTLEENGAMMRRECDYRAEAAAQDEFGKIFANHADVLIPKVHNVLSAAGVLTSEFVDGATLQEFLRQATQNERNHAGEVIFKTTWTSIFRHGLLNADPHPGNYLFLPDGRVAFLDFGFTRQWAPKDVDRMRRWVRAIIQRDAKGFAKAQIEAGVAVEGEGYNFEYDFNVATTVSAAHLASDQVIRFDRARVDAEIRALVLENPNLKLVRLPPEFVGVDRMTWGLNSVLALLEAEANWHRLILPILDMESAPAELAASA